MAKIATKHLDVGTASGTVAAGNHTHAGGAGVLLQVRYVEDRTAVYISDRVTGSEPPLISEGGDTNLRLTYTPVAANSLLEVVISLQASCPSSSWRINLFDSSVSATICARSKSADTSMDHMMTYFAISGSTAPRTFSVRVAQNVIRVNPVAPKSPVFVASFISVKEYAQ